MSLIALIIVSCGGSIVVLAASVLLVTLLGHPNDSNTALFPKFITILSLFCAFATALLFPLDIAFAQIQISINYVWIIMFTVLLLLLLVFIPFALFFFESDQDPLLGNTIKHQIQSAVFYSCIALTTFFVLVVSLYFVIGVPRKDNSQQHIQQHHSLVNHFVLFMYALLAFVGWFSFSFFLPIGLIMTPLDLISNFCTRPKTMSIKDFSKGKVEVGQHAAIVLAEAEDLQSQIMDLDRKVNENTKKVDKKKLNMLVIDLYELQSDCQYLDDSFRLRGGNPIFHWAKLVAGVISLFLSLAWIWQVLTFLADDKSSISCPLDTIALTLPPPLSAVFISVLTMYLIVVITKGVFTFAMRFPSILSIYPLELGKTMTNAMLVHTWWVLVCALPALHFTSTAFTSYASHTAISSITGAEMVLRLQYLHVFWTHDIFNYIMLSMTALSLLFTILWPRDTAKRIQRKLETERGVREQLAHTH